MVLGDQAGGGPDSLGKVIAGSCRYWKSRANLQSAALVNLLGRSESGRRFMLLLPGHQGPSQGTTGSTGSPGSPLHRRGFGSSLKIHVIKVILLP
jgi:hypothetical protein